MGALQSAEPVAHYWCEGGTPKAHHCCLCVAQIPGARFRQLVRRYCVLRGWSERRCLSSSMSAPQPWPPRADAIPPFMTARRCPGHSAELALSFQPVSLFSLAFRRLRASLGLGHSIGCQLSGSVYFLPLCFAEASFFTLYSSGVLSYKLL